MLPPTKQALPSGVQSMVLRLLRDGPPGGMYGLELVNASGGALARGTIYVTLLRMQERGLVTVHTPTQDVHPGMPRPRYRISALAQRVLAAAEAAEVALHSHLAQA